MKIGIMSDLHLDFKNWDFKPDEDIFYIIAGDIAEDRWERSLWLNRFDKEKLFWIKGNHDFYNDTFDLAKNQMKSKQIGNLKIVGATLWTHFYPQDWLSFLKIMRDGSKIYDLSYEKYIDVHQTHKKFLMESNADIWVIHHCPSFLSVHKKFSGEYSNIFFATELYNEIISLEKPPKLIIHGHTHEKFDYMIGDTRVICHPRGYPHESADYMTYKPLILEIDNNE